MREQFLGVTAGNGSFVVNGEVFDIPAGGRVYFDRFPIRNSFWWSPVDSNKYPRWMRQRVARRKHVRR